MSANFFRKMSRLFIILGILLSSCSTEQFELTVGSATPIEIEVEVNSFKWSVENDSLVHRESDQKYYTVDIVSGDRTTSTWQEFIRVEGKADTGANQEVDQLLAGPQFQKTVRVQFLLTAEGAIDSILNWTEIDHFVDSVNRDYIAFLFEDSVKRKSAEQAAKAFSTHEHLTNSLFNPMYAFHKPYGLKINPDSLVTSNLSAFVYKTNAQLSPEKMEILGLDKRHVELIFSSEISDVFQGENPFETIDEISDQVAIQQQLDNNTVIDSFYVDFDRMKRIPAYCVFWRDFVTNDFHLIKRTEILVRKNPAIR